MQKVISAIMVFLLTAMVAGVFYLQYGKGDPIFFTERSSVPLIVLTFGLPVMIFVLWLYRSFLKEIPATRFLAPRFFEADIASERLAYQWEKVSVFIILILPLIGFLHFWERFDKGTAWPLETGRLCDVPAQVVLPEVDLYKPTKPLFYGLKARYRYGSADMLQRDSPARNDCSLPNGVDYYPFVQPLIMAILSGIVLVMASWNLILVMRRRPIRYAAVQASDDP